MNTLLVGYDLNKQKDYPAIWSALEEMGTWWHHLDSTWLVRTEMTPVQLRNALREHIDSDDELLVIDVTGRSWAGAGFSSRAYDWLKKHL
jgi:hypothetical protein